MSTVWLVHPVKHDMTAVKNYAPKIRHVNRRFVYTDEIYGDRVPMSFRTHLHEAADEFRPDTDYVMLAGDPVQLVLFVAILLKRHGRISTLRWDRLVEGYVRIDIGNYDLVRRSDSMVA